MENSAAELMRRPLCARIMSSYIGANGYNVITISSERTATFANNNDGYYSYYSY